MAAITSRFAIFNNFNLHTVPNLQVYSIKVHKLGNRKLNIFQAARRSYRKTSSAFFASRQIDISVWITAGDQVTLEKQLDILWANIMGIEADLVVPQSGGVRKYNATFGTQTINQDKGGFIDMTLTFECSDNYGYDTNYSVLIPSGTSRSSNLMVDNVPIGGGAETQAPIIQVKITAVTGNPGTIAIGNNDTGQQITVSSRTWNVNDLLIIDCQNRTVQVNGVDVAFTGAFPEFAPGVGKLSYQDSLTTRTISYFAYLYQRWN